MNNVIEMLQNYGIIDVTMRDFPSFKSDFALTSMFRAKKGHKSGNVTCASVTVVYFGY